MKELTKKELGYLIGVYIGDGYLYYHKKSRHYKVEFFLNSVKDLDIKEYLESLLSKFDVNIFIMKDKRSNVLKVYTNSKHLFNFINDEMKLIDRRKRNKDYCIGLISGFIDAEGYLRRGTISVCQKEKWILTLIGKILERFKLHHWFYKTKSYGKYGSIWRLFISTKFKYLPHNSLKVNRVYSGGKI